MLLDLKIKNYKSFKDENEISFVSLSKIRKMKDHEFKFNGLSLIKNCALFGGNAKGKSNIISSLSTLKDIVINGFTLDNFSFIDSKDEFTTFEIVFTKKENIFQYILKVKKDDSLLSSILIKEETLNLIKKTSIKNIYSFKEGILNKDAALFKSKNMDFYIEGYLTSKKGTFLNYIHQEDKIYNDETRSLINDVFYFFLFDLIVISKNDDFGVINTKNINNVSKYLSLFDAGIEKIEYFKIDSNEVIGTIDPSLLNNVINDARKHNYNNIVINNNKDLIQIALNKDNLEFYKLTNKHLNIDKVFNFNNESDGTKRLMYLTAVLFGNENNTDKVFLIDEIEKSIHPLLCSYFIKTYQEFNKDKNNQLIFSTHNFSLMDEVLRKDEIYFIDKDKEGKSYLTSLLEYKSRDDSVYSKKYLEGRFGGVPNLMVKL